MVSEHGGFQRSELVIIRTCACGTFFAIRGQEGWRLMNGEIPAPNGNVQQRFLGVNEA